MVNKMERVRVPKTAEVVAHAIRTQIVQGDIGEDDALPSEAELMSQFGVSRPSLREAFRILESEKLITVRRGSRGGARAMRPDVTVAARYVGLLMQFDGVLLADVFQARALIEPLALRLMADTEQREESAAILVEHLGQINDTTDSRDLTEIWLSFFQQLFELSGNATLRIIYGTLTEVIRHELSDTINSNDDPQAAQRVVLKAMELVAKGKGEEAAEFWMGQMFRMQEQVARQHRTKTVADIAVDVL
jgi:DNA-binding FadR family transcriptional regulator